MQYSIDDSLFVLFLHERQLQVCLMIVSGFDIKHFLTFDTINKDNISFPKKYYSREDEYRGGSVNQCNYWRYIHCSALNVLENFIILVHSELEYFKPNQTLSFSWMCFWARSTAPKLFDYKVYFIVSAFRAKLAKLNSI